jgi:hypothetical protein
MTIQSDITSVAFPKGYKAAIAGQDNAHLGGKSKAYRNLYQAGYLKGWAERDLLIEYEQQIIKSLDNN